MTPLSSAPVPRSHESRCAPIRTTSSGASRPRISATTFWDVYTPPVLFRRSSRIRTSPFSTNRARRSKCSRLTIAEGTGCNAPSKLNGCRYSSPRGRVDSSNNAATPAFFAAAMSGALRRYSAKRSSNVFICLLWMSANAPAARTPNLAKSASVPSPASITCASRSIDGVKGAAASRIAKLTGAVVAASELTGSHNSGIVKVQAWDRSRPTGTSPQPTPLPLPARATPSVGPTARATSRAAGSAVCARNPAAAARISNVEVRIVANAAIGASGMQAAHRRRLRYLFSLAIFWMDL